MKVLAEALGLIRRRNQVPFMPATAAGCGVTFEVGPAARIIGVISVPPGAAIRLRSPRC